MGVIAVHRPTGIATPTRRTRLGLDSDMWALESEHDLTEGEWIILWTKVKGYLAGIDGPALDPRWRRLHGLPPIVEPVDDQPVGVGRL
jgi:hypothetical protein